MNIAAKAIITSLLIASPCPLLGQDADERPILKEPPVKLVGLIESLSKEYMEADRVNITYDIAEKRVRIFSSVSDGKIGVFNDNGYTIQIVYNRNIAASKLGVGSYHFQHNVHVLTFAAAEFAAGRRAFG